jgi:hypothetical protein
MAESPEANRLDTRIHFREQPERTHRTIPMVIHLDKQHYHNLDRLLNAGLEPPRRKRVGHQLVTLTLFLEQLERKAQTTLTRLRPLDQLKRAQ